MALRILVVNPNGSEPITARVADAVRAGMPGAVVEGMTNRDAPPYLGSPAGLAAALDGVRAILRARPAADAALLACFADAELGGTVPYPVLTLSQAAFAAMRRDGRPFSVVTGGHVWREPIRAMAAAHGCAPLLSGVRTLEANALELGADRDPGRGHVLEAIARCRDDGAARVLVAGAGFAGVTAGLRADAALPLLDSVECAVAALGVLAA